LLGRDDIVAFTSRSQRCQFAMLALYRGECQLRSCGRVAR